MKFKILQDSPPSKLSFKRGGTIKKAWKKLASLEDNWCIAVEVFPPFFWKISLEAWHSKISTCKQPQQKALKREIWEALPQKPGKFRCVLLSFLGRFFWNPIAKILQLWAMLTKKNLEHKKKDLNIMGFKQKFCPDRVRRLPSDGMGLVVCQPQPVPFAVPWRWEA